MKKTLLACLALTALTSSASATPPGCLDATDPVGDAETVASLALAMPPLDLVHVGAAARPDRVTVTFSLDGAPTPPAGTDYQYWIELSDAAGAYHLVADIDGGVRNPRAPERFYAERLTSETAGTEDWVTAPATGSVDLAAKSVTVTAPASSFGVTSFPLGHTFAVNGAETRAGALQWTVGPVDKAAGDTSLTVRRGGC